MGLPSSFLRTEKRLEISSRQLPSAVAFSSRGLPTSNKSSSSGSSFYTGLFEHFIKCLSRAYQTVDAVPGLDLVVRGIEDLELFAAFNAIQPFNLVVADPQLLQRVCHRIQALQLLDVVSSEGKDLEIR